MLNRQTLLQAAIIVLLINLGSVLYQSFFGSPESLLEIDSMPSQVVTSSVVQDTRSDRFVLVTTEKMKVLLDTNGGRVARVSFNDYTSGDGDYLFFDDNNAQFLDAQVGYTGDKNLNFKAGRSSYTAPKGGSVSVRMTATNSKGVQYSKTFVFDSDSYAVKVSSSVLNRSDETVAVRPYYAFTGDKVTSLEDSKVPTPQTLNFDPDAESLLAAVRGYNGVSYPTSKKAYVRQSFKDMAKGVTPTTMKGGWVAFQKHHFISAWVMDDAKQFKYSDFWLDGETEQGSGLYEQKFVTQAVGAKEVLTQGSVVSSQSQFYVGPQIKENLIALAPTLKLTLDYGFFWMIANFLGVLLKVVHSVIPSWGWCLVMLVLLARALLYPMTQNQAAQAKAMKKIQPEKAQIDKRFEGRGAFDLEKHEALTALYKKHNLKIGIFSALAPFIQLPLFIAFYGMISVSVEFRQSAFLWISDLSLPDPFYILPASAVLVMFWQSEDSEVGPEFKMVMRFLPIVFALFVVRLPASLQLYAGLNTVLHVLQTKMLKQGAGGLLAHKK